MSQATLSVDITNHCRDNLQVPSVSYYLFL